MSDTSIFFGMLVFFIGLGVLMPFITAEFSDTVTEADSSGVEFEVSQQLNTNEVTVLGVMGSVITIFFWSFAPIPIVVELLLLEPLRILFYWLFYRQIRGVGG